MAFDDTASTAWTIRICDPEDAERLALIGAATALETFAGRLPGEAVLANCSQIQTVTRYAELLAEANTRIWIVESLGAPIGYCVLMPPHFPGTVVTAADLEVRRIYLLSRFHGTGLGDRMMRTAMQEAGGRGARRLLLGVHQENARALRFYAKHGFTEIGRRSFQLGPEIFNDPVLARML